MLSAIYAAISLQNLPMIERIMQKDFKKVNELSSRLTKSTPLHYAVYYGCLDSLRTVLSFMHADQKDKQGNTPLVFLAKHSELLDDVEDQMHLADIAELLLDNKADFYAYSAEGKYALEIAREKNKTILVDKLMEISTGIKPTPAPILFSSAPKLDSAPKFKVQEPSHHPQRKAASAKSK